VASELGLGCRMVDDLAGRVREHAGSRKLEPDPQLRAAAFEELHFVVALALEHEHAAVAVEKGRSRRSEQSV